MEFVNRTLEMFDLEEARKISPIMILLIEW